MMRCVYFIIFFFAPKYILLAQNDGINYENYPEDCVSLLVLCVCRRGCTLYTPFMYVPAKSK